jgi:hypothetical protein
MSEEKLFKRGLLLMSAGIVAAFVVICAIIWMQGQPRGADAFLIPQGYTGEVVVSYNVDGAPELKSEEGYFLNKIGTDGKLQTSTKNETSFPRGGDKFYYVDAQGKKTELHRDQEVWDGFLKEKAGTNIVYGTFFVGTKKEWEEWAMKMKEIEDKEKKTIRTGI